jgi:hypothetical protein
MTTQRVINPAKIRKIGLDVLGKSLGPVGMTRFLQQFDTGSGDYTKDREQWLKGLDVKSIVKQIKKQQTKR